MPTPTTTYVFHKSLTRPQIERLIGEPSEGWARPIEDPPPYYCGLGRLKFQAAYHTWIGKDSCYLRVFQHVNGVCVRPGLDVDCDNEFARRILQQLTAPKAKQAGG